MRFYNVKKRIFANGQTELRIYQKSVLVGGVRKSIKKKIEKISTPFENIFARVIKNQLVLDSNGFTVNPSLKKSIYNSLKRTKDKVSDYAKSCKWEYFCTFTFDSDTDRYDYDVVSKKMSQWLKNVRKKYCKDLKYLIVPEKHTDGAYHFHALFANIGSLKLEKALNHQEFWNGKKNKYYLKNLIRKGQQVYNLVSFKTGFTDCTKVRNTKKVANYVLKYITKDLIQEVKFRKRYWVSYNLDKVQEQTYLLNFSENDGYDNLVTSFIADFRERNNTVYVSECVLQHADFENRITYIHYDSSICDVEFDSCRQC